MTESNEKKSHLDGVAAEICADIEITGVKPHAVVIDDDVISLEDFAARLSPEAKREFYDRVGHVIASKDDSGGEDGEDAKEAEARGNVNIFEDAIKRLRERTGLGNASLGAAIGGCPFNDWSDIEARCVRNTDDLFRQHMAGFIGVSDAAKKYAEAQRRAIQEREEVVREKALSMQVRQEIMDTFAEIKKADVRWQMALENAYPDASAAELMRLRFSCAAHEASEVAEARAEYSSACDRLIQELYPHPIMMHR
ncbi:MAG: hypothetical protein P8Y47_11400 [Alphaproteobacteria bacterium]